mmetsp:Transcript_24280/g.65177  ORF Transcript_24280/g.65177 Transcript_24280/m.65177 type:complete len:119 (-) Transcript_24280:189-545(-)
MLELSTESSPPGVLCAGVTDKPTNSEMWFKSFGNVPDGTAFVMRLPLSALTATTAPTAASAGVHTGTTAGAWYTTLSPQNTVKAAREIPGGGSIVLTYRDGQGATLARRAGSCGVHQS